MAKKETVRFRLGDGVKPNRVGPARVFNLKSPLTLNIPPKAVVKVDLGLACNYPLHVFEARSLLQRGLRLLQPGVLDADGDVIIGIENLGSEVVLLERGDVLARAAVIDNTGLSMEE